MLHLFSYNFWKKISGFLYLTQHFRAGENGSLPSLHSAFDTRVNETVSPSGLENGKQRRKKQGVQGVAASEAAGEPGKWSLELVNVICEARVT